MINEILFFLLVFIATVLSTAIGFGSALIVVPLATFFLPVKSAIAILTVYGLTITVTRVALFKKHINWKLAKLILYGAVPSVIVGALTLVYLPTAIIQKILGGVIILYVINEQFSIVKKRKLNNAGIAGVSVADGFIAGIVGMGNLVRVALLTHIGLRKETFIATIAVISVLLNVIKIFIFYNYDLITSNDIPLIAALVVIAFSGTYLGKGLVKKVSPELFKNLILIALVLMGVKLLVF
jgi:uncharacterized protein